MTLVETVSKIRGKQVTEDEAKDFALKQFGLLATHIRNEVWYNIYSTENYTIRLINTLYRYYDSKGIKVNLRCIPSDMLINFDIEDFRNFKSVGRATIYHLTKVFKELDINIK